MSTNPSGLEANHVMLGGSRVSNFGADLVNPLEVSELVFIVLDGRFDTKTWSSIIRVCKLWYNVTYELAKNKAKAIKANNPLILRHPFTFDDVYKRQNDVCVEASRLYLSNMSEAERVELLYTYNALNITNLEYVTSMSLDNVARHLIGMKGRVSLTPMRILLDELFRRATPCWDVYKWKFVKISCSPRHDEFLRDFFMHTSPNHPFIIDTSKHLCERCIKQSITNCLVGENLLRPILVNAPHMLKLWLDLYSHTMGSIGPFELRGLTYEQLCPLAEADPDFFIQRSDLIFQCGNDELIKITKEVLEDKYFGQDHYSMLS